MGRVVSRARVSGGRWPAVADEDLEAGGPLAQRLWGVAESSIARTTVVNAAVRPAICAGGPRAVVSVGDHQNVSGRPEPRQGALERGLIEMEITEQEQVDRGRWLPLLGVGRMPGDLRAGGSAVGLAADDGFLGEVDRIDLPALARQPHGVTNLAGPEVDGPASAVTGHRETRNESRHRWMRTT